MKVYALYSPSGRLVPETITAGDLDECKVKAFEYLHRRSGWARSYWKQWEAFIAERKARGWTIYTVNVYPAARVEGGL